MVRGLCQRLAQPFFGTCKGSLVDGQPGFAGQTDRVCGRRPGWQWGSGLQAGCVGLGKCFVVFGSLVSQPTGEGSSFKIRGVLVCRWH